MEKSGHIVYRVGHTHREDVLCIIPQFVEK